MPGHGLSPPQDNIASQDDLLDAIMGFVEEILPGKKFAIVGESRGSYIAHGMIQLNPAPICGAALIAPGGSPTSDLARLPSHEILVADPAIYDDMTEDEKTRFDNF